MGTLSLLVECKMERVGRQIRSNLAGMRRRRLILSAAHHKPERNPDLDPLLGQLRVLRVKLALQLPEFEADETAALIKIPVLARAREILSDATELIDLLVWFGAEMHIEPEIVDHSGGLVV